MTARPRGLALSRSFRRNLTYLLLVPAAALFAFPLVWLAFGVFRPAGELLSHSLSPLPQHWTLRNLRVVFAGQIDIPRYFWNTVVLCVLRAGGTVLASSLAAYAFTKLHFRGRNALFVLTLCLLILPTWALLVPQYRLFDTLGWLGTIEPLTVPMFFGDPFTIFLLASFMRRVPGELSEAAELDGAGHCRTYWHVVLPSIRPALVVAVVLSVIDTYNDFFGQIIYLNNQSQYTLALATFQYVKVHGAPDIGAVIAFTAISVVPLVIVFFLAQRQLRETNVSAGLKD